MTAENPAWMQAIDDHVEQAYRRLFSPQETLTRGINLIVGKLILGGEIEDLGSLQEYLHGKEAFLQIAAVPHPQDSQYDCIHPLTREPKNHWMGMTYGYDPSPAGEAMRQIIQNHERNVDLLRRDTGIWVPRANQELALRLN